MFDFKREKGYSAELKELKTQEPTCKNCLKFLKSKLKIFAGIAFPPKKRSRLTKQ